MKNFCSNQTKHRRNCKCLNFNQYQTFILQKDVSLLYFAMNSRNIMQGNKIKFILELLQPNNLRIVAHKSIGRKFIIMNKKVIWNK